MTIPPRELKGNSVKLLKEANKYLIFQCIMKLAPISVEEIVKHTKLSRPTVLNIIRELSEENVIVKEGFSESSGGRSAALLGLNGEGHFALGVDFEFPTVRLAIANMKGQIRARENLTYPQDIGKDELIADFHRRLNAFIESSGIPRRLIDGAGVGLSGVVDTVNGTSLNIERIRGWHNVAFREDLEKCLQMPVYLKNDVHLMGLVEKRLYLGDAVSDFIYVGVRSGIGSIAYQNNRPMNGDKGNAGFIGHATLDPHGPQCCCGSRGCLEVYAGKLAMVERYAAESETRERVEFDEMVARARAGEKLANTVLTDAGFYFGIALANLIKTLEIPYVVVGGSPALDNSPYMDAARRSMEDYITNNLGIRVNLQCGRLPEEQFALGGCYLVFDHLFSKPKLALSLI